jgi:predicted small secreted protein
VNAQLDARLHFVILGIAILESMKSLVKYLMIALVLGFGLAACEPEAGAGEDAGVVEDTGAAVEGAAEETGEALEDTGDAALGTEEEVVEPADEGE